MQTPRGPTLRHWRPLRKAMLYKYYCSTVFPDCVCNTIDGVYQSRSIIYLRWKVEWSDLGINDQQSARFHIFLSRQNDGGNRAAANKLQFQNPLDRRLRLTALLSAPVVPFRTCSPSIFHDGRSQRSLRLPSRLLRQKPSFAPCFPMMLQMPHQWQHRLPHQLQVHSRMN